MSTRSSHPDWITYVPRRVYDAARRLEAACDRCGCPSPIGVAEYRSDFKPTVAQRVLWRQVWCFLMKEECIPPGYDIDFVVVDHPAIDCIYPNAPQKFN